jgi:Na+/phosphate symporter
MKISEEQEPTLAQTSTLTRWVERLRLQQLRKLGMAILSLGLFILALFMLKEGSRQLGPFVRESLSVTNPVNALGFGWLFAYAVMSGSPVAAITLTLLDVGSLSSYEAYAMITGSRLGASFIVLFIGFIYALRGKEKRASLATGLLSLLVTQTTYIPALILGIALLSTGWTDQVQLDTAAQVTTLFDRLFEPLVNFLLYYLPRWVVFGLGFGVLMVSFTMLDKALPKIHLEDSAFSGMARILYRPVVTFLLGALVTVLTMSVSLSLSILVPLSMRGYVRQENAIPYVMGANITTFIDTLIAAILLANPLAFTVVLVNMVSITLVSMLIILLFYRSYERSVLGLVNTLLQHRRWLIVYMFVIFALPLIFMFL